MQNQEKKNASSVEKLGIYRITAEAVRDRINFVPTARSKVMN